MHFLPLDELEKEQTLGILDEADVLGPLPVEQILQVVLEGGVVEEALLGQEMQIARVGQTLHKLKLHKEPLALLFALLLQFAPLLLTFPL